ncbi:hypothetical protein Hanom_Chr06g00499561 [Helianthus anomalus]
MQAFSCLATLPASALVIACPATNTWSLSPTREDIPVKSTHACFPHSHPKTRMSEGRSVDLPSNGSVKKFTGASFFTEIPARLRTSYSTSRTKSCQYLKPGNSLQCTACSPKESKQHFRHTGHGSSAGKRVSLNGT